MADNNPLENKSAAWSARFAEPMSDLVKRYTASVGFDRRLWKADIAGSLAHADMLAAAGVIGAALSLGNGLPSVSAPIVLSNP